MPVEGGRVDPDGRGDVAYGCAVKPVLRKKLQCREQDAATGSRRGDSLRQRGGHRVEPPGVPLGVGHQAVPFAFMPSKRSIDIVTISGAFWRNPDPSNRSIDWMLSERR